MSRNQAVFLVVALALLVASAVIPQGQQAMTELSQLLDRYETVVVLGVVGFLAFNIFQAVQKKWRP